MPLASVFFTSPQNAPLAQSEVSGPSLGSCGDKHEAESSMHSNIASQRCEAQFLAIIGATRPSQYSIKSSPGPRQLLMAAITAVSSCQPHSYALAQLLVQLHAALQTQPIATHPAHSAFCEPATISRTSASVTRWLSSRWPALWSCSAPPSQVTYSFMLPCSYSPSQLIPLILPSAAPPSSRAHQPRSQRGFLPAGLRFGLALPRHHKLHTASCCRAATAHRDSFSSLCLLQPRHHLVHSSLCHYVGVLPAGVRFGLALPRHA